MKAAVINTQTGGVEYREVPNPTIQNEDEVLIQMLAAAIKHVDRSRASGTHYSSTKKAGDFRIIGGDGVGLLADGTRVYALGVGGMAAEYAVVDKDRMVTVPQGLDHVIAAALPNAVIGAAMGLRFRADMQPGDTVLINGATGFTGRVAVQIAKYYGAQKVIATGRDPESLKTLLTLGANEVISLQQSDEAFIAQIQAVHQLTPIHVIIDYLWGHSAELLFLALKGKGNFTAQTRFVSVGSVAGDTIALSAANLRSVNLLLSGSGLGSWTREDVKKLFTVILPEMFQLATNDKLHIETVTVPLAEIESIYDVPLTDGKRLVVTLN
ncbi:quinone oxidoreductase family protein [Larkinella terrae]|uniref:Zinc-binding dehydrogenase n=1 Tax=Larkinella terrae TaxID=2025311 RepID=A0A7K0EDD1_9BACT|nr:zinc-binding dehydrogenase [Larkinella terrae]MRS59899.1 zinc-binding dehydrogenase [Larkinella terrae]